MKLEMNKALSEMLVVECPDTEKAIRRANMFGNKETFEVEHTDLGLEALTALAAIAQKTGERGLLMQLTSLRNILANPETANIGNLKAFQAGLLGYLQANCIDGWMYERDAAGEPMPSLVTSVQYREANARNAVPAKVVVSYVRNKCGIFEQGSFSIERGDVHRKTLPQLLLENGFHHETPDLRKIYDDHLAKWARLRADHGKQFRCTGMFRGTDRYDRAVRQVVGARMVNDEGALEKNSYNQSYEGSTFDANGSVEGQFDRVPMHPFIYMFDMKGHVDTWFHVSGIEPYVYQPELRDKLVLPEEHRDLIEVLTEDMDVLMEDTVEGKTGGSIIICSGAPGLGKTLSAEVYAEVVQRPLYRVHSGQLGTTAAVIEKQLQVVFERAERWGAVLLIDEADVFVRARGEDLEQNAVVAVFLRAMEAFAGLMFMTTNRASEIDDAVLSRCVAQIKYKEPSDEDSVKLWEILAPQFKVELSKPLIAELTAAFPNKPGRDIRNLLKLTSKFCRRKELPYTVENFRKCAQFRGM